MARVRGDEVYIKTDPKISINVQTPAGGIPITVQTTPGTPIKVEAETGVSVDVNITNPNEQQQRGVIGAVEVAVTFTAAQKSVLVYNDGPYDVHYSIATGVAITNFKIPAFAAVNLDAIKTVLYFICAAGESATVYCYGVS